MPRKGSPWMDNEIEWLIQRSPGALGLKAAPLFMGSGRDSADEFFSQRQIEDAGRQRRIRNALHSLSHVDQGVLISSHTPIHPNLHARVFQIDPVDDLGCSLASVCFWICHRGSFFVVRQYARAVRTPDDGYQATVERGMTRVLDIEKGSSTDPEKGEQLADVSSQIHHVKVAAKYLLISALERYRSAREQDDGKRENLKSILQRRVDPSLEEKEFERVGKAGLWMTARSDLRSRFAR
jgi:hypothetical protein